MASADGNRHPIIAAGEFSAWLATTRQAHLAQGTSDVPCDECIGHRRVAATIAASFPRRTWMPVGRRDR